MSEIPFPLVAGQYIEARINNQPAYFEIVSQSQPKELTLNYLIPPSSKLTDQQFNLGNGVSVFVTDQNTLKQWVSWIDNINLEVSWTVTGQNMNILEGITNPLTFDTSPYGSTDQPFFLTGQPRPTVSFDLINGSTVSIVRGVFKVIVYEYAIKQVPTKPAVFTRTRYAQSYVEG